MNSSLLACLPILLALGAGPAAADTANSNGSAAAMEHQASPSNPVKQDEERTEAHSQPDVPQSGATAQQQPGAADGASAGASAPTPSLPSSHRANRANNGYYYQSGEFNEIHPEEAYPNDLPRLTSPGEHSALIQQVQEKLRARGFDAGPANGDFGSKTQAALAQFQLSQSLPVSGSLDSPTLNALGVVAGLAPSGAEPNADPPPVNPPSRPSP
ncbi:MAG TPA: peptidoglycan-binding domain-containing protein [Burkholderiales bacterium]|jgi:hypothetical protein|nr:peptidoglycan-binding domain-containing protein [Burkholderiales bacterium]